MASLTNPHKKKSGGVRSGDLAGHVMYGDPPPVHLEGNCLSKNDFSYGGLLRTRSTVRDLAILQERIYATVNNVTPQMLHNTWVEVEN